MEVIVAGAGIVGVSTAIWLQRAGHSVRLIDRGPPASGTSYGNAGVLAAGAVIPVTVPGLLRKAPKMLMDPNQPLFLRWRYLPKLLPFLKSYLGYATQSHLEHYARQMSFLLGDSYDQHMSLARGTGAEKYVHDDDYCFGYPTDAAFQADKPFWDLRAENGHVFQVEDGASFSDPVFSGKFAKVVRCKNHGRISDPGKYVCALADHFQAEGGTFIQADIKDIDRDTGSVTTDQGVLDCDHLVLAFGAWSGALSKKLGLKGLKFESERGYHIELVNPSSYPKTPMMVAAGKFVITPMDGRIRAAGVVEFGGLDAPASQAPFDLLKKQVQAILPGITYDRMDTWMGHRPAPADSLPLIGPLAKNPRVLVGFGHQHVGLTGGPKTGRLLADMISGVPVNEDLSPFDPDRYS